MNRVIITFLFFFSVIISNGQELLVKSFSEKISDLSASTQLREDNNGTPCALMKVQLPITGAEFKPNVIGEVEYKTNEYWVYLPTINKKLEIRHPKHPLLTIQFSDYGITLQPKTTYVLVVTDKYNVTIQAEPTGAEIKVDGDNVAYGQFNGEIKGGEHTVKLSWPGYKTRKETIVVDKDSAEFKFTLPPNAPKAKVINNVGNAVYFSPTYQVIDPSGVGLAFGVYNGGVNAEISLLYGLNKYPVAGSDLAGSFEKDYKDLSVSAKVGYGFRAGGMFRITPQLGYVVNLFDSFDGDDKKLEKTSFRQMAVAHSVSASAKFEFVPVRWLGISVAPEYNFRVSDGKRFKLLKNYSEEIDKIGDGFRLNLSLNIYIPYGD